MNKNNDNRNNNIPESFESKSLEELWELLLGKDGLEVQKAKYEARKLKPDYREGELNLYECPMCGSDDVPNVDIDFDLNMNNDRIKSIKMRGGKCSRCGETFYDSKVTDLIRKIKKLLD
ncbi:YgiT-type zinc finger domain-containing protein [Paenibacillus tianmuensis]|uniref:YgiT-type zinc finger domain-containing protein n=1 Tax=Paenibacillus tianmuensis TaxID=624147 RepID=A0A1G4RK84_9BACL|nr:YgiT-type zinc finger protein [Paenibacillus tianmuensis]SCW57383.1 YgiT-type zinc finger domain-containing protein [Paenibacillus tianmuensis]